MRRLINVEREMRLWRYWKVSWWSMRYWKKKIRKWKVNFKRNEEGTWKYEKGKLDPQGKSFKILFKVQIVWYLRHLRPEVPLCVHIYIYVLYTVPNSPLIVGYQKCFGLLVSLDYQDVAMKMLPCQDLHLDSFQFHSSMIFICCLCLFGGKCSKLIDVLHNFLC